jgi:hypothetical protein
MNTRVLTGVAVVWFLTAALRVLGQGSDVGAWMFFNRGHSDGIGMGWRWTSTNMVRITALKGDWTGVLMSVDEQGLATVSNEAYSWASQGTRQEQLAGTNVARLRQLFRELGQSTNSVPFWITNISSIKSALPTNQLVMVSFRDGSNWVQRQYSDGALPRALFDCYNLIIPSDMGTYPINRGR